MRTALRRRFVWLCVAVAFVALAVGVAGSVRYRNMETHEIFVAQTARQMLAANGGAGDWVRPVFNDKPRLNKPPLMYWLVMSAAEVLPGAGTVDPWVARLPSALASVVMALCTVWLGRLFFNASVGLLAGTIGVGSVGWIAYANNARPEMVYAACSVVMLTCFAAVWKRSVATDAAVRPGAREWALVLGGWLAGGLAILAKGPQIPVVLLLGFVAFAVLERNVRGLLRLRPLVGLPLMLLVPVPWVLAVLAREPGGWQAWTRDLFEGRSGGPGTGPHLVEYLNPYYLYGIPGLLLPWAVALPWALVWGMKKGRPERWGLRLSLWLLVVPGVVMSLSIHRRDYYMLALMPVMAVAVAGFAWSFRGGLQKTERQRRGWLVALLVIVGVGGFAAAASPGVWSDRRDRMNEFARLAAAEAEKQIGPEARIVMLRGDPAFIVYARNKPVPVIDTDAALGALIDSGGVDAVLVAPKAWEAFVQGRGEKGVPRTRVLAEFRGTGRNEDESGVLLKLER